MRKFFSILNLICGIILFNGQSLTPSPGDQEQKFLDINPPSSESFYRTSFGNVPLNEYKGMENLCIPLFNINYGSISFPITLNYAKLGVQIDDIPNDVGVSWLLETGGVINRIINGANDELYPFGNNSGNRRYFTQQELGQLTGVQDGSEEAGQLFRYVNYGTDTELDQFNFTLPGASGSFILDKDLKPKLVINKNQCRIEAFLQRTDYQFIVTTNNGIKYYFGGLNANEITKNRIGDKQGVTSYYISKIEDGHGHTIYFEYNELPTKTIIESITQRRLLYTVSENPSNTCSGSPQPGFISNNNTRTITPKTLKRIYFNNLEYRFERSDLDNNGISKLNKIQLFKNNNLFSEFRLSYIDNTTSRFFLQKIEEWVYSASGSVKKQEYAFDYYEPDLPKRLSFAKDYLGYYNGKNNSELIPDTQLLGNMVSFLGAVPLKGSVDRRPDFNFAVRGSLKSITYPTKGKTVFEYEPNKAKQIQTSTQSMMVSNEELSPAVYTSSITISRDAIIGDSLKIGYLLSTNSDIIRPGYRDMIIRILDANTNAEKHNKYIFLPRGNTVKLDEFSFKIEKNVDYKVVVTLNEKCDSGTALISITYDHDYTIIDYAGIRLKKAYDISDGNVTNIRRLYYNDLANINNPLALSNIRSPNFYSVASSTGQTCIGMGTVNLTTYFLNSSPNAFSLSLGSGNYLLYPNQQFYNHVTISHGGDNFEKGGEEKEFSDIEIERSGNMILIQPDQGLYVSGYMRELSDKVEYFHNIGGNLLKSKTFIKKNNNFYVLKKDTNEYEFKEHSVLYSLVGVKAYEKTYYSYDPAKTISNYLVGAYSSTSFGNFHKKNTITEYQEDILMNVEDDSPYKKLETQTEFYYNNPSHYQLTDQKTTFPDGSFQLTNYKYAHDKPNQKMIDANMVGIPLITETTKTADNVTKTISKTETLYPTSLPDVQTGNLLLPKSASSLDLLTGAMATDVTYNQYDSIENLLQYTTKLGITTAIVWGYNNTQPIAKIEGAPYALVSSLASAIISASDTDASAVVNNDETSLLAVMKTFREALPNYQVTTYTYDPLVGVRSITPPNGIRQVYIYDTSNRLKEIRENNQTGNLLKEFQYNYKH